MLTVQNIAEIVAETVEETAKDMERISDAILLIAKVTAEVMDALHKDPDVGIQPQRSRSLKEDGLVFRCVTRIKEGY